jgi:hypothetical protein
MRLVPITRATVRSPPSSLMIRDAGSMLRTAQLRLQQLALFSIMENIARVFSNYEVVVAFVICQK